MSSKFSVISAIVEADIVVKLVIGILIVLSISTWSIFFQKASSFKLMKSKNGKFEKKFWSGVMLEEFYELNKMDSRKSQYAEVFVSAMEEWILSDVTKAVMAVEFIKSGIRERILYAIENSKSKLQSKLSSGLQTISITASLSPFIGLFGTVWGVMNSFTALSEAGSITLTAVAPGISEALFATAIGLFVALPAIAFYSKISNEIDEINTQIDSFGTDIINVLSRELDAFSVNNYNSINK